MNLQGVCGNERDSSVDLASDVTVDKMEDAENDIDFFVPNNKKQVWNDYTLEQAKAVYPHEFLQIEFYQRLHHYKFQAGITPQDKQLIINRTCQKIPAMQNFNYRETSREMSKFHVKFINDPDLKQMDYFRWRNTFNIHRTKTSLDDLNR